MQIYEKQADKINQAEGTPLPFLSKTVLILPSKKSDSNKLLFEKCTDNAESLLRDKRNVKIYSVDMSSDYDIFQEVMNHNQNHSSYFNEDTQQLVNRFFLPILENEKRLSELNNLTIISYSYGTTILGMLENCLKKTMTDLGYDKNKQKRIMGRICSISISPVTNINDNNIGFKKIFFSPSNDKLHGICNINANHLINTKSDNRTYYKNIGKNGLLVHSNTTTLKFDGDKLHIDVMAHAPKNLITNGHDLYNSQNPDLFPTLIRNALNNAVNRKGEMQDLTELLRPIKQQPTVSRQEGYSFTEQLEEKLVNDFIKNGNQQGNSCRLH